MIKYGVERISNGEDKITMYNSLEAARAKAEEFAENKPEGGNVMLFSAECNDDGKLATNEFNVIQVW